MRCDLAVVGAGQAGLAAAAAAAEYGLRVAVFDEGPAAGGRLPRLAGDLVATAADRGVQVLGSATVWAADVGAEFRLSLSPAALDAVPPQAAARAVVVATGAVEQPVPVPGWTLPGVISVGAAQVLLGVHRLRPGRRVVISGIDLLSLGVAAELAAAGVEVVGIALPAPGPLAAERAVPRAVLADLLQLAHLAPLPWLRCLGPAVRRLGTTAVAAHLYPRAGVRLWGVPVRLRQAVVAVTGDGCVEQVWLAPLTPDGRRAGAPHAVAADTVLIGGGLAPLAELAAVAGCRFVYLPNLGGHVPLHGPTLATTVPGLFVAGSATGVEGAPVARAQGRLAGLAAARWLGAGVADASIALAQAAVVRERRQALLAFAPGVQAARADLESIWRQQAR